MASKANKCDEDIIREAVQDYAAFHAVELGDVDVTREEGGGGRLVRFRLSLDADGRSHGCDEWYDVE